MNEEKNPWIVHGYASTPDRRYWMNVEFETSMNMRGLTAAQAHELAAEIKQVAEWMEFMQDKDPQEK